MEQETTRQPGNAAGIMEGPWETRKVWEPADVARVAAGFEGMETADARDALRRLNRFDPGLYALVRSRLAEKGIMVQTK